MSSSLQTREAAADAMEDARLEHPRLKSPASLARVAFTVPQSTIAMTPR